MKTTFLLASAFAILGATAVFAGQPSNNHGPAPTPAPAGKAIDLDVSVYGKVDRDTTGKQSAYDIKLNQSEIRNQVLGINGTNDVLVVNSDDTTLKQHTEVLASGNTYGQQDLNKVTFNGGSSTSLEQQGSTDAFGVGLAGDTTFTTNNKAIASQTVAGGVVGSTTKFVNSDNN